MFVMVTPSNVMKMFMSLGGCKTDDDDNVDDGSICKVLLIAISH